MPRSLCTSFATAFALASFLVCLIAGWFGDNHLVTILERSLMVLLPAFVVGWVVGYLFDGILVRHAQDLRVAWEPSEVPLESELDPTGSESDGGGAAGERESMAAV